MQKTGTFRYLTSQPLASGILTGKYGMDTKFAVGDNRAGFWTEERFQSVKADMEIEKLREASGGNHGTAGSGVQSFLSWNFLYYPRSQESGSGTEKCICSGYSAVRRGHGKTWKHEGLCILTESSKSA